MTKRLQKNIYQVGNRIIVRKTVFDNKNKDVVKIPVRSVHEGVSILAKLEQKEWDYKFGFKLQEKQRIKLGLPAHPKKRISEAKNLYKINSKWVVRKRINNVVYSWHFENKSDAVEKRNELRAKNWNLKDESGYTTTGSGKYGRFEEVMDIPRLTIPKKKNENNEPATKKVPTPVTKHTKQPLQLILDKHCEEVLRVKAGEYNTDVQCMGKLAMQIGLQQLERLNFIPEYEGV